MKKLDKIKNFSRRFGVNLLDAFIINIFRSMINEALKNVKPIDVYNAIQDNTNIWSITPDKMKQITYAFKNRFEDIINSFKDFINKDTILAWLAEDQPEIYSTIINTPNGEKWLDEQIQDIKNKLLG